METMSTRNVGCVQWGVDMRCSYCGRKIILQALDNGWCKTCGVWLLRGVVMVWTGMGWIPLPKGCLGVFNWKEI